MLTPEGDLPPESPAVPPSLAIPQRAALLRSLALGLEQRRALALVLLFSIATLFRCFALDASGFAEDEVNKLQAVEAYRRLDFTANAEHPMLMKLAALGSIAVSDHWNRFAARLPWTPITPETALRVPNAFAGGLTTVFIFLLVELLFDVQTAGWAALLWALDVNATAINRIAKEDTLLVLCFFAAVWCYQQGRRNGWTNRHRAQRWYDASGAAFGLMWAAKYMPHYFAMHAVFIQAADPRPAANRKPDLKRFYRALIIAFFVANFGLLVPANIHYLIGYMNENTVAHNGYFFARHLYLNAPSLTPWGLPPWFYFAAIGTKVPVMVLLGLGLGLIQLVKRRREWGFIFLRVVFVFFLLGYSLVASKFIRYMLPLFAVIDIIAAAGIVWTLQRVQASCAPAWARAAVAGALVAGFAGSPLYAQLHAAPNYSLYRNAIGARLPHAGYLFPHCEFYDAGVREAVQQVAAAARPNATLVTETPRVASEYLARAGRGDVQVRTLSGQGLPARSPEVWLLVQDGRIYFENAEAIEQFRLRLSPWREIHVGGAVAVEVFRLPPAAKPVADGAASP